LKQCLAMKTGSYLIHMHAYLTVTAFQHESVGPHPECEGVARKLFFIVPPQHFQDFFATGGFIQKISTIIAIIVYLCYAEANITVLYTKGPC